MNEGRKSATERNFQDNFVQRLQRYRWQAPDELDGNKQKVTVIDLIDHWRDELNRMNADVLEGVPLTDNEFRQVMTQVNKIENSYEAAKILSMEQSTGKIDGIYRDSHPNVTREQITLTIFRKSQVSGGESSYKIAREVETPLGHRFDLILLINGLPLIHIELKRTDKSLEKAFNQFKRYYAAGEFQNNFMAFSQMMVMSSEVATRYFATPKSLKAFNPSFVFHWADQHNKPINHWKEVIDQFLMIPMAHQMVGDYLVIDEAKDEENRKHMLLRPYQVYALQAIEAAALGKDNKDGIPHGGYVWHTTGSGKTITSFKTALFLSTKLSFDKVLFLVDRKELDSRTSANFKAYAEYEAVTVDDTSNTHQLRRQMLAPSSGIIVTTTYKLNNLVKEMIESGDNRLAERRLVFMIDEAHRTTMGDMMVTIKQYFRKNGLFYGFTGTPLFDENKITGKVDEKSEMIDTTEKLFGKELHKYTIDEAIKDKNVLGFHVDYINTGEFASYDALRDEIIAEIVNERPKQSKRDIEREIYKMTDYEVETEAIERKLLVYHDETHIPKVVTEILDHWDDQSQGKFFNGILTVAYKKRVIAYYKEFKKQLKERDDISINVAMTVSFGTDDQTDTVGVDLMKEVFADYASFTGVEYIYRDRRQGEDAYYEDVVDRLARGGSGRNPKNIDLIIVADQLLTGYDSKYLNTLYVDRQLKLQHLIQAYSRTNRIFGAAKEFGAIVNFMYPRTTEKMVNDALILYGSGGKSSPAIVDPYDQAKAKLTETMSELKQTLQDPTSWQRLEGDEDAKAAFLKTYRQTKEQLNTVQQYYVYEWDDDAFGLTEHEWMRYEGAFKNLTRDDDTTEPDEDETPVRPLGETKLAGSQQIDAPYIIQLIEEQRTGSDGQQPFDDHGIKEIYRLIDELSNIGEHEQAQLLKQFVHEEIEQDKVAVDQSIDEAYAAWKNARLQQEINDISKEWGIDQQIFEKAVHAYATSESMDNIFLEELTASVDYDSIENPKNPNPIKHSINLGKELPNIIYRLNRKYH